MTVKAMYMGQNEDGSYWVNVKSKKNSGLIGSAGFIRKFDNKEDAKKYADIVNKTGEDVFVKKQNNIENKNIIHQGDVFTKIEK